MCIRESAGGGVPEGPETQENPRRFEQRQEAGGRVECVGSSEKFRVVVAWSGSREVSDRPSKAKGGEGDRKRVGLCEGLNPPYQ